MLFYKKLLSNDTKISFLQNFSGFNPISTELIMDHVDVVDVMLSIRAIKG